MIGALEMDQLAKIKVIGLGGGGGNAVNRIAQLVTHHILCYIYGNKLISVVDSDCLTYEVR